MKNERKEVSCGYVLKGHFVSPLFFLNKPKDGTILVFFQLFEE